MDGVGFDGGSGDSYCGANSLDDVVVLIIR